MELTRKQKKARTYHKVRQMALQLTDFGHNERSIDFGVKKMVNEDPHNAHLWRRAGSVARGYIKLGR